MSTQLKTIYNVAFICNLIAVIFFIVWEFTAEMGIDEGFDGLDFRAHKKSDGFWSGQLVLIFGSQVLHAGVMFIYIESK